MRFWKSKLLPLCPKVGIAVAAYLGDDNGFSMRLHTALRGLVASFQGQTHHNWKMLVVHDGKAPWAEAQAVFRGLENDKRVSVDETETRKKEFGHPHRQAAIEHLLADGCDWIGLTNQDNWYAPTYLEWMLHDATTKKAEFVCCDFVSSHKMWKPVTTQLRRGGIDLGCFLAHRSVVEKVKFDKFTFAGDWDYISRLTSAAKRSVKVNATLFVHN